MTPDIAMCWDGRAPVAELTVDGATVMGSPGAVDHIFHALNRLRDRAWNAEHRLVDVVSIVEAAAADVRKGAKS